MTWRMPERAAVICWMLLALSNSASAWDTAFKQTLVEPQGRIDAIAYLGDGVVVAGSRGRNDTGYIFLSDDCGATWRTLGNVTGTDFITCLQAGGDGLGYLLTGRKAHVWKTADYGKTWIDLGQVCSAANSAGAANAYGLAVTRRGTVLVADADDAGGRIHRSTDQGASWQQIGPISSHPLYRLQVIRDGIVVNGWAGHVYKSADDGLTWRDAGNPAACPLFAIEHMESDGTVLVGAADGRVFRSRDDCQTWNDSGKVGDAADDFAWLGRGRVLYSTYDGSRQLYSSEDSGATWETRGPLATEPGDWLDHFLSFEEHGTRHIVGGTNKGFILHAELPR